MDTDVSEEYVSIFALDSSLKLETECSSESLYPLTRLHRATVQMYTRYSYEIMVATHQTTRCHDVAYCPLLRKPQA
jgi:hypothetical protein